MNRVLLREGTFAAQIGIVVVVVVDKNRINDCGKSLLLNSQRISKTNRIRMSFYIYHTPRMSISHCRTLGKKRTSVLACHEWYYYTIGRCSALFIIIICNIRKRCIQVYFILNILALFHRHHIVFIYASESLKSKNLSTVAFAHRSCER